ncbi:hypothetical protein TSOC_007900 [Tetrabaena socialis]|uniref:Uncharacterized protein n=1 Tax=Tetrabaena socialis TaxID=47790 RepID=A0A2J7ZZV2_9CHLO|nr:hypothetical protein TSOC_007900 [Tetrabaena socialis]|eukprot:PNH05801.1 hypothetical protein TSOC_007900 [Tetrabaena socialis]
MKGSSARQKWAVHEEPSVQQAPHPFSAPSEVVAVAAAAKVYKYRQQHSYDEDDEGGAGSPVGTWQAAQAQAAARKVVPVLKRGQSDIKATQHSSAASPLPPVEGGGPWRASNEMGVHTPIQEVARSGSLRSPTEITWQTSANTATTGESGSGSYNSRSGSGQPTPPPQPTPQRVSSHLVACLAELGPSSSANSRTTSGKKGVRWG